MKNVEEKSTIVKVVFPGEVLPDHLIYDSLLMPVKEFRRSQMRKNTVEIKKSAHVDRLSLLKRNVP